MSGGRRDPRAVWAIALAATTVVSACSEPTSAESASTFSADVTGATTARLTGSAALNAPGDWARESVVQVTLPNAGPIAGIVLSATGGGSSISILRQGAELTMGTFRLGSPSASGGYGGGYVARQADGLKVFMADSGTVTLSESGSRVVGTFTVYLNSYTVIPLLTRDTAVGQRITPLSTGQSPLTITGTFSAERR